LLDWFAGERLKEGEGKEKRKREKIEENTILLALWFPCPWKRGR
jgi:hypothetical protein